MNNNYQEDEYRAPIEARVQNLIFGDMEPFGVYKRNIMARRDLDADMKQVMIATRKEYILENMPELVQQIEREDNEINEDEYNSDEDEYINEDNDNNNNNNNNNKSNNNDSITRANNLVGLVEKMNQIKNLNNKLSIILKDKLSEYVSCKSDLIILETEVYIEFEDILPKLELSQGDFEKITYTIIPKDYDALNEYKQVIKQSKIDWESQQEKKRIRLEQDKIQLELNNLEKEKRIKITQMLDIKLLKIVNFDSDAKELKNILTPLFDSYNSLEINKIALNKEIYDKITNFILKSRFSEQEKNSILEIFSS